jgi:hypothetical protein
MVLIAGIWALAIAKDDVPLAQITSGASAPAAISVLASAVTAGALAGRDRPTPVESHDQGDSGGAGAPDANVKTVGFDVPPPTLGVRGEIAHFFRILGAPP